MRSTNLVLTSLTILFGLVTVQAGHLTPNRIHDTRALSDEVLGLQEREIVGVAPASLEERSDEDSVALAERAANPCPPDHPDWYYLNGHTWWKDDPTQQDHARLHAYLSMSAYGDYKKLCPKTFVKEKNGFTVLSEFSVKGSPAGQSGYIAKVPEMKKIVIVFKGNSVDGLDFKTAVSVSSLVSNCGDCKVAKGVYDLYMLAKKATNDFAVAKQAVKDTGLLFSVTGHGVGGAVAALAGLDLGARNLVHYAHQQGAPRAFNAAAVKRYDNLFQVLSGQSLVARNDPVVLQIPTSSGFCHVGSKIHITGDKTQWLTNCYGNNENATCLGNGKTASDHSYYFTPVGSCGAADKGF